MKPKYYLYQRLVGYFLLISSVLPSCSSLSDPLILKEEDEKKEKKPTTTITNTFKEQEDKQIIAKGGHLVSLYQQANRIDAKVYESAPIGFKRELSLPVYKSSALASIQDISQLSAEHLKNHVHVCFPEKDACGEGYVYVGSVGLMGGGKKNNKKGKNKTKPEDNIDEEQLLEKAIEENKKKQEKKKSENLNNPLYIKKCIIDFQESWFNNPQGVQTAQLYKNLEEVASQQKFLLERIKLLYPTDIKTPVEKYFRCSILINFYNKGVVVPSFSKQENEEIISILKKFVDLTYTKYQDKIKQLANIFERAGNFAEKSAYIEGHQYYLQAQALPAALNLIGTLYQNGHLENGKPNYEKASTYYKKAATPESLKNLGRLYLEGKVDTINGFPNYTAAKEYLQISDLPEALNAIGVMIREGHIKSSDDQPDYQEAQRYFEKSQTPHALANLGLMFHRGEIGKIDGQPDYQQAEAYYDKSNTPYSLIFKAKLYEAGCIDGMPDYMKALALYEKSACVEAKAAAIVVLKSKELNLLYSVEERKSLITKNLNILESKLTNDNRVLSKEDIYIMGLKEWALGNWQAALLYLQHAIDLGHKSMDFIMDLINQINKQLETEEKQTALYSLDKQEVNSKDSALASEQTTITSSSEITASAKEANAPTYKTITSEVEKGTITSTAETITSVDKSFIYTPENIALQKEVSAYEDKIPVSEVKKETITSTAETITSEHKSPISTAEAVALEKEMTISKNESTISEEKVSISTDDPIASKKVEIPTKLTKEQKKIRRAKMRQLDFANLSINPLTSSSKPMSPRALVFVNDKEKEEFLELQKRDGKIRDLLKDIQDNRWKIAGSGKPEILKNPYRGHKGCYSRRINDEDRLVYKIQPGSILILGWEGHYE